ncbi:MAG TPA: transposase [Anaerolineae bacterium]
MPYEYRHMTPAEREEVVRQRRARGYPLHSPPHPFRRAGQYMLTAVNYEHNPIMAAPSRRTEFEARLLTALNEIDADVSGWVILPNHYHVLVGVASLDHVSHALKHLHGATAREWNLADGMTGTRRVWYKFWDRLVRDERHFFCALNYIHINPVKHGYVKSPYEWPWLSIENYLNANGRAWLQEKWKRYPPGDFGRGWDD